MEKSKENERIEQKIIPKYSSHEDYEQKCPSLKDFLSFEDEEVLFICVGSSEITGCCLKLLETIKDKKITVLYTRPDIIFLNEKTRIQEKIVYNIFQEYTRSGLLEKIYLFDNPTIEKVVGNISILNYYEKINETIASTYHMINVLKHLKPLWEANSDLPSEGTRIGTIRFVRY